MPLLNVLKTLNKQKREIILNHIDSSSRESFYACLSKIVYPDDNLTKMKRKKLRKKLEKHQSALRDLVKKKISKRKKRELLLSLGDKTISFILDTSLPLINKLLTK